MTERNELLAYFRANPITPRSQPLGCYANSTNPYDEYDAAEAEYDWAEERRAAEAEYIADCNEDR